MRKWFQFAVFLLGLVIQEVPANACPTCDSYTGPADTLCGVDGKTYSSQCELLVALCKDGTIALGGGADINLIPIHLMVDSHIANDGPCSGGGGGGGNCPDCGNVTNAISVCDTSITEYTSSCEMAKKMCEFGVISFGDGFDFTTMTEQLYRDKVDSYVYWNGKCSGPCPVGEYSASGQYGPCKKCAPGTFAANPGSQTCDLCDQDSYQPGQGAASCIKCPNGTDTLNKGSVNVTQCVEDCLPGHYSTTGKAPCTKCDNGMWTDVTKATTCQSCPAGRFSNGSSCIDCPAGQFSTLDNSVSCVECPVGQFTNGTGSTGCTDCPPGTYVNHTGSSSCKMCEKGTYNNDTGATFCKKCEAGTYQIELGKTFCFNCTQGTFQNSAGNDKCENCPKAQYQDNEGASSCKQCPDKRTTYGEGSIDINECHFTECDAGTMVVIRNGKVTCDSCKAGFYQNKNNQTDCKKCPWDTYQDAEGSVTCIRCPNNHVTYNEGASQTADCEGPAIKLAVKTGLSGYTATLYDKKEQLAANLRGQIHSFEVIRGDWYIFNDIRYHGRRIRLSQGVQRADVNDGNQFPRITSLHSGSFYSIRPVITNVMCYVETGKRYTGYRSRTQRGVSCQNWRSSGTPHANLNTFSDIGIGNHNYCRNPDNDPNGPWCYTTDRARRWDYCGIPKCKWNVDCYTERGEYYRGTKTKTAGDSYSCNDWYSNFPHPHSYDNDFNDQHYGTGHHRYCRNPNAADDNRPWCYTTNLLKRWAYCDVPKCEFSGYSYFTRNHVTKT